MSELNKILKVLTLAAVIVISLQLISAYILWPTYNPSLGEITKRLKNTDVVFFSDSSDKNVAPSDGLRSEAISQVLANGISPYTLEAIAEPAYHLHTFQAFTKYISRLPHRPKLALYSINARSFSSEYYLRPGYVFPALCKELELGPVLFRAFIRPLHIFGWKYKEESFPHGTFPVTYEGKIIGTPNQLDALKGIKNPTDEQKKLWIEYAYGYPLTTEHPLIQSIKSIIRTAKLAGIEPLFYFTPVDISTGSKWFGSQFSTLISSRMDLIIKVIQEENGSYLDLSHSLTNSNYFNHHNIVAEHLTYLGRDFVGHTLAKKVNEILADKPATKFAIKMALDLD